MSLKFYVATERLKQTQIAHVAGDLGKGSPRFSTASWDSTHARYLYQEAAHWRKQSKSGLDFTQTKDNLEVHWSNMWN